MRETVKAVDWKAFIAYVALAQLLLNWLKEAPIPASWMPWVSSTAVLCTQLAGFFTRGVASPPTVVVEGLPDGADTTGPKDDVPHDVVTNVISSALPPMVSAAAPELASNIAKELGRVLKRGIRL